MRSPPPPWFDLFHGADQEEHQNPGKQNDAADPERDGHSFISKLVNSTPPTTSAIQAKLFELKANHWLEPKRALVERAGVSPSRNLSL